MSERIDNLKLLIERSENCRASHLTSTVVRLPYRDEKEMAWEGVVETFDLLNHAAGIRRAYAWARPPDKTNPEAEYKVVLGKPPINSPEDAVKAAMVAVWKQLSPENLG